jgi:hypothetical protein
LRLQTRCSLCGEGQHRVNSWKQSWRCCRCAVGTWWWDGGWGRWSLMVGCCVIAFLEVGSVKCFLFFSLCAWSTSFEWPC